MNRRPVPAPRAALLAIAVAAALLASGCQLGAQPAPLPSAPASAKGTLALRVTRIADGDTFTGKDSSGTKVKVRVLSIDAPELAHGGSPAGCGAQQAARRLAELISGSDVRVVPDPVSDALDRYGRHLGYLEKDGRDVGRELVEEGLVEAWYPSGEPRPARFDDYAAVERAAQQARKGSWGTCPSLGR